MSILADIQLVVTLLSDLNAFLNLLPKNSEVLSMQEKLNKVKNLLSEL